MVYLIVNFSVAKIWSNHCFSLAYLFIFLFLCVSGAEAVQRHILSDGVSPSFTILLLFLKFFLYHRGIVIFNIVVTDLKRCQQTTLWRAGIIITLLVLSTKAPNANLSTFFTIDLVIQK